MNELVPVKVKKIKDPLKELKKRYDSLLRLVNNNDLICCEQLNKINMRLNALDNKSKTMHNDIASHSIRIGNFHENVNKSKIENSNYINQIKNNIIADTISYIRDEINKNFVRKDKDFDRENAFTKFIEKIESLNDPLLKAVFIQSKANYIFKDELFITISFKKEHQAFKEWIFNCEKIFKPLLEESIGTNYNIRLSYLFQE